MQRKRIDTFLVEHGLAESREQAKRLILAGAVTVNGDTRIKPGQRVPDAAKVVVQEQQKYVSRGGFKLEKALSIFDVDVEDRVALDVGASTGGFTDCLLQHGAKFVYAVDVGYGQLAWKLRTHPQVQSLEKTNIRHLTPALVGGFCKPDGAQSIGVGNPSHSDNIISIAVIDVSFISLRTVLPSVIKILRQANSCQLSVVSRQLRGRLTEVGGFCKPDGAQSIGVENPSHNYNIIALLKPQFEAGKVHVKKGGIVPDQQVHIQTIDNLSVFVTEKLGATVSGLTYSPIHKDIGNIEYLLWLTIKHDTQENAFRENAQPRQTTAEVVAEAHELFGNR